jgi:hypothetical protein
VTPFRNLPGESEETHGKLTISGFPAEIRTECLPNLSPVRYLYTSIGEEVKEEENLKRREEEINEKEREAKENKEKGERMNKDP